MRRFAVIVGLHNFFTKKAAAILTATAFTTNLVSRILFLNYHLSGPVITDEILLPTLDRAPICIGISGELPSNDPLRGITAPKVYP